MLVLCAVPCYNVYMIKNTHTKKHTKNKLKVHYFNNATMIYHIYHYKLKTPIKYIILASIVLFFTIAPDTQWYKAILYIVS